MPGPTLHERFEDLERRIDDLERQRSTGGGDHDVASLFDDLRGQRDRFRQQHLAGNPGAAATWASEKGPADGGRGQDDPQISGAETPAHETDADAEAALRDMEAAFDRARTRFR